MGVYNKESGYGKHSQSIPFTGGGQVFVVAKSAAAGRQIMQDTFKAFNGKARYFATVDSAVNACTASRGDVIFVSPGHTEAVTSTSLALDVVGVTVIHLGSGAARPTYTFAATTSTIVMSAASCRFIGKPILKATVNSVVAAITVSAANCEIDVETQDTSATVEFISGIVTTAAADQIDIKAKHIGFLAGAVGTRYIDLVGANTANIDVDYFGVSSVAVVNMRTTASDNVRVTGKFHNGTTNLTKDVVDTVGTSTWSANGFDVVAGANFSGGSGAALAVDDSSAIAANQTVATVDGTANALERDVIGNKTDAAVTTVGTTKSIIAYAKGLVQTLLSGAAVDGTANATLVDVVGNKTDASVYVPGTTKSLAAYGKGTADLQERVAKKTAATIVNGQVLFTIAGGPVEVLGLVSICETANDATASTLQYSATPTVGAATTISGASASLANAAAGASVTLAGTALATAALLNAGGPNLIANPGTIMVPAGTLTAVVAVGSTTGTWAHYLRFKPLATGVTVS